MGIPISIQCAGSWQFQCFQTQSWIHGLFLDESSWFSDCLPRTLDYALSSITKSCKSRTQGSLREDHGKRAATLMTVDDDHHLEKGQQTSIVPGVADRPPHTHTHRSVYIMLQCDRPEHGLATGCWVTWLPLNGKEWSTWSTPERSSRWLDKIVIWENASLGAVSVAQLIIYLPGSLEALTSILRTQQTRQISGKKRQGDEKFSVILSEFEDTLSTWDPVFKIN